LEIAEAPVFDPLSEAEINVLLSEDPHIGESDWHGNKVISKRFMPAKHNWLIKLN
tara:strand:+ start:297 stop:461 length:165 start_codon:yes stop_codon:yes gene_type:complete